jgi:predicted SnoaL-like aldol condensation-catalyzing enzyme
MAVEENKALIRRAIEEAHNNGNLDVIDEVYASDYVLHTPTPVPVEEMRGPEAIKRFINTQHAAFPSLEFIVEDQIAEGDKVVTRYVSAESVMHNAFGVVTSRIADGKIAEEWIVVLGSEFQ